MIMQRLTFYVKQGSFFEAIEMLKERKAIQDSPLGSLICATYYTGELFTVIHEIKFENHTELEGYWKEWSSHPDMPAFRERWDELQERSGKGEVFHLVE